MPMLATERELGQEEESNEHEVGGNAESFKELVDSRRIIRS